MPPFSPKFITGIILILTNQIVAWGGIIICAFLSKEKTRKTFIATGISLYIISWIMLALGIVLTGREGLELAKQWLGWETIPVAIVISGTVIYLIQKRKKNKNDKASS